MNQNSEHINQDLSLRWTKTSTQQQINSETLLEQNTSKSWTPMGPTKVRSSGPSQLNWKPYNAGAIIKSEARSTGVQLKRSAKLLTVTGLTTKHPVCRVRSSCCIWLFCNEWFFFSLIDENKPFRPTIFLTFYTNKNQKWDPLRAIKTFIRRKVGHTK